MTAALTTADIDTLGASLAAARGKGAKPVVTPARVPASDEDAYRIQQAIATRVGRPAKAWKVGAANAQSMPNGAPIFDVFDTMTAVPGAASTGVELEIAFRLARGFAAGTSAPSRADVEAAIGAAHIALETCASRLADGMKAPAHLRLADFGTNLGLVIGPEVKAWRAIDSAKLRARITSNGGSIADMTGGHTCPDLVGLLTWIVGHAVTSRGGMPAGTWVTTGSWMGIQWVTPPSAIVGTFDGLGSIEVKLTAG